MNYHFRQCVICRTRRFFWFLGAVESHFWAVTARWSADICCPSAAAHQGCAVCYCSGPSSYLYRSLLMKQVSGLKGSRPMARLNVILFKPPFDGLVNQAKPATSWERTFGRAVSHPLSLTQRGFSQEAHLITVSTKCKGYHSTEKIIIFESPSPHFIRFYDRLGFIYNTIYYHGCFYPYFHHRYYCWCYCH